MKYVGKEGDSLLVAEKNRQVDEETVTGSSDGDGQIGLRDNYCSGKVCRRLGLVITFLALAACVAVIAVSFDGFDLCSRLLKQNFKCLSPGV